MYIIVIKLHDCIIMVWLGVFCLWLKFLNVFVKICEDKWMYDSVMSEEVDMNDQNEDEAGVNEEHVNCSDAFNTSQVLIWFIVIIRN